MDLSLGLDLGLRRGRDPAGLGAALVLGHQPAGGQHVRERGAGVLGRLAVFDPNEPGPAVGGREAVGEQSRSARVGHAAVGRGVGTRPEDALLGVDPLVADAGVVGDPAGAGPTQLVVDAAWLGGEELPPAEPAGQALHQIEVVVHPLRWAKGLPAADHPALQVGHGALLLGPLGGREDDVGERGGLGQEDVGDHEQVQRGQPVTHSVHVGGRDDHVGGQHEQGPDAPVGAHPVEHLEGRQSRLG